MVRVKRLRGGYSKIGCIFEYLNSNRSQPYANLPSWKYCRWRNYVKVMNNFQWVNFYIFTLSSVFNVKVYWIIIITTIITTKMITTMSFIHFQRGTLCAKGTFGPSHKVPPICYCLCATLKNIITLKSLKISLSTIP